VVLGVGDGDGVAEGVAAGDDGAEFHLVVEHLAGAEGGGAIVGGGRLLAVGAADGRAGGDDGGGAAVVADGDVLVVGQERVVGAEHRADIGGVVDGGVEVGVVADRFDIGYSCRQADVAHLLDGDQTLLLKSGV
jgi:hypothetical protein